MQAGRSFGSAGHIVVLVFFIIVLSAWYALRMKEWQESTHFESLVEDDAEKAARADHDATEPRRCLGGEASSSSGPEIFRRRLVFGH